MRCSRTLVLTLLVLAVALAGCSPAPVILTPAPSGTLRIVSSLPSRGASAGRSREMGDAIRLALKERAGEARGVKVEYVALEGGDDETGEWSSERELANATASAADPSVIAYIGPYTSGAAAISLPVTNRAGLLQAGPSATWPGLTLPGWNPGEPGVYYPSGQRTFVRLMPPDSAQADAAAQWASSLHIGTVALLDDGSSYSVGMENEFVTAAARASVTVSTRVHLYPRGAINILLQIAGSDAIFYAPSSADNAVRLANSLSGSAIKVFSTDTALDSQFIDQAGESGRNWLIVSNSAPPAENSRFGPGGTPAPGFPSQFAANAYDVTNIIMDGIFKGAVRDRSGLVKYVLGAHDIIDPARGALFTSSGDPSVAILSGFTWSGGKFAYSRSFEIGP